MVAIRLISAFVIANLIGWLLHHYPKQEDLLVDTSRQFKEEKRHQHHHDLDYKKNRFISIFRTEFWSMFSMLSIGAFVAAGSQTFIPRSALLSLGSQPVLSILAMLALAFILSLCANVDAFFALAYSNIFTFGALAAFLVFGPMIDIKTLLLMKTTFKTKTLIMITSICLLSSLSLGLVINHGL